MVGSAAFLVPSDFLLQVLWVLSFVFELCGQGVCFFCSLCCQVWRLCEANMASRPYLSPCFMSSLLLSVLTYSNFIGPLPEVEVSQRLFISSHNYVHSIPIVNSSLGTHTEVCFLHQTLAVTFHQDSNFLVHSLGGCGGEGTSWCQWGSNLLFLGSSRLPQSDVQRTKAGDVLDAKQKN